MATARGKRMAAPERRIQLLQVARKTFGRNGFHGVSMEEVAREAGVTKPTLYDHFTSKQDLYLALLEADSRALGLRVHEALVDGTGNRERIRQSFRAYFDFVDEHAEGFKLLMQETQSSGIVSSSVAEVRDQIMKEVAEVIARESKGRIDQKDSETVAAGLVGMVEAGAQRSPGGAKIERERQVDLLVRLAWMGIAAMAT
ncbi:MAG: TetR/AcrR family transcriptional regulator [Actinomycetota bacterium]